MFAIGHFALGYLTGKATSKLAHVKINLPLLLAISVIPDMDLLFGSLMNHRGLTHSVITIGIFSIPFFIKYKKAMLPYLAALLSHVFLGDFFTGGIEFLWPLSKTAFGLTLPVNSALITIVELTLFCISLPLMYKLDDIQTLFKPANHNFLLIICCGATIGPLFWLAQGFYDSISLLLVVPSLIWLSIFAYSILIDIRFKFSFFCSELKVKTKLNAQKNQLKGFSCFLK
jgi:membrane-bound metal-dependent hydrolase YbcI (DUF457 family)